MAAVGPRVIRVGEVPGSNPGAPIYLCGFAGILFGGDRSRIGVMVRRYRDGAWGSLRFLIGEIPAIVRLLPAVRSQWLRPDRPSAAKGTDGGMPGKCRFRWGELEGASVASLPNPCLNSARGARGTSVHRSWPESFRRVPRRASGLALGVVRVPDESDRGYCFHHRRGTQLWRRRHT